MWSYLERLRREDPPSPSRRLGTVGPMSASQAASRRSITLPALERRLAGDLDAITLKAINRDPTRRYSTPEGLAADIDRHLQGEPITARAPSTLYLLRRFLRQWRKTAVAAGLVTLILVAGFVARSIEARRANEAARLATAEAARTRAALAETQELVDFLTALFEAADPESEVASARAARQLLDLGVETLSTNLQDRPLQRAHLLSTIGLIYTNLGLFDRAEETLVETLALRERHLSPNDPKVAETLSQLGVLYRQQERTDEARAALQRALAIFDSSDEDYRSELAQTHSHLGNVWWKMARYREAEEAHRRGLEIRNDLGAGAAERAESLNNLAVAIRFQGRWDEARALLYEATDLFAQELGEGHPRTTAARFNLGRIEEALGNWDEAGNVFRESLAAWQEDYGVEHPRTRQALASLHRHLARRRSWPEAIAVGRRWVASLETDQGTLPGWSGAMLELAEAEALAGDSSAARRTLSRLESDLVREQGPDSSLASQAMAAQAWLRWIEGDSVAAVQRLDQLLARLGEGDLQVSTAFARASSTRGQIAAQQGDRQGAERLLRQAVETYAARLGAGSLRLATARLELGALLVEIGRPEEAHEFLEAAQRVLETALPQDHPDRAKLRVALADDAAS